MFDLIHCLTNLLFFDIPLLYCYANLNSSTICFVSPEDMYLFFGKSFGLDLSASVSSFGNSLVDFFETLVASSAILLPIKSSVPSVVFELLFLIQFLLYLF